MNKWMRYFFGDKAWIRIAIASRVPNWATMSASYLDTKLLVAVSDVSRIVEILLCCPCPYRAPIEPEVLRSCNPPSSSWNMLGHLVWRRWLVDLARRPYMKQVCVHLDVSEDGVHAVHIPFSDQPISSYSTPPSSVLQHHVTVAKHQPCNADIVLRRGRQESPDKKILFGMWIQNRLRFFDIFLMDGSTSSSFQPLAASLAQ